MTFIGTLFEALDEAGFAGDRTELLLFYLYCQSIHIGKKPNIHFECTQHEGVKHTASMTYEILPDGFRPMAEKHMRETTRNTETLVIQNNYDRVLPHGIGLKYSSVSPSTLESIHGWSNSVSNNTAMHLHAAIVRKMLASLSDDVGFNLAPLGDLIETALIKEYAVNGESFTDDQRYEMLYQLLIECVQHLLMQNSIQLPVEVRLVLETAENIRRDISSKSKATISAIASKLTKSTNWVYVRALYAVSAKSALLLSPEQVNILQRSDGELFDFESISSVHHSSLGSIQPEKLCIYPPLTLTKLERFLGMLLRQTR